MERILAKASGTLSSGGAFLNYRFLVYPKEKKIMKKGILLAATAMVLGVGIANAAEQTVVTQNPDGSVTTTTTTYYFDQDANNNGILDSQEFNRYVYTRWDRNRDGFVTPDEWNVATTRWYAPQTATIKTYSAWDKNGDGRLDASEFDVVVKDTNLYRVWDANADNTIESGEYATSTFSLYDLNKDGTITIDEWKQAQ